MRLEQSTLPMPTFAQAREFARRIGIATEKQWEMYVGQLSSRADLFSRVASLISGRCVAAELSRP